MKKLIAEYNGLILFFSTLKAIIPFVWMLRKNLFIHYHLAYGWDWNDYDIIWTELHKAHVIYARKMNQKYRKMTGIKDLVVVNPGTEKGKDETTA